LIKISSWPHKNTPIIPFTQPSPVKSLRLKAQKRKIDKISSWPHKNTPIIPFMGPLLGKILRLKAQKRKIDKNLLLTAQKYSNNPIHTTITRENPLPQSAEKID
jgi:hypothetical protein